MKVRVIKNFTDKEANVDRVVNDVFECSKERAAELLGFELGNNPYPLIEMVDGEDKQEAEENKEDNENKKQEAGPKKRATKKATKKTTETAE